MTRFFLVFLAFYSLVIPRLEASWTCRRAILRTVSTLSYPVRDIMYRKVDLRKTGAKTFHQQRRKKWALENHIDAHDSSQMGKAIKEILEIQIESYAIAYRKQKKIERKSAKTEESVVMPNVFQRKYQIFDPKRVREIFGRSKTVDNLSVAEVVEWIKTHQDEVLSDLESSSHYAVRTWVKRGGQVVGLLAIGALASFGTSYFNSRAGGFSAAVSERAYSDSRLSSYQAIYGKLNLEDPELAEEYRYYHQLGEKYFSDANAAFSNWSRVGKWDAIDTAYSLERLMTDIELAERLNFSAETQEFRIRILYQFVFSLPEYRDSEFEQELQSFKTVIQFLERHDPDKVIRARMLNERNLGFKN